MGCVCVCERERGEREAEKEERFRHDYNGRWGIITAELCRLQWECIQLSVPADLFVRICSSWPHSAS